MSSELVDDFSCDDEKYEQFFRQKVEEGLRQLDSGEGIEHEEAIHKVRKWLR
jgi:predicted transcriptional regulator